MARNTMNSIAQKAIPMHQVKRSTSPISTASLHVVEDAATLRQQLEDRDKAIAQLESKLENAQRDLRWISDLMSLPYSECKPREKLATYAVHFGTRGIAPRGDGLKNIRVDQLAKKVGMERQAMSHALGLLADSGVVRKELEDDKETGRKNSLNFIALSDIVALSPRNIHLKEDRPVNGGLRKVKLCPKCGGRHFKNKCDECGTTTADEDMVEVTEDEAPRVQENIVVRRFINTFTSHENYNLYLDDADQIVIGVPHEVDDREFAMYEEFVLEHKPTLRKMLEGKRKR